MTTTQTRAAIKRASQQARNAMQLLDADTARELLQIYHAAADQVRAAIRAAATAGNQVPMQHLQTLLRQVEDIVEQLGDRRDAMLDASLDQAAALGTRPYTLPGVAATGIEGQAVLTSPAAMRVNQSAVDFVRAFRAADGLNLSDRLWRLNAGAKEALGRAITNAVVQGWDSAKAAADLVYRGQPVPAEVAARAAAGTVDALVQAGDLLTNSTDGGELWKAQRVMRTEINRAHGEAFMAGGERTPSFAGWKFLLSHLHPRADICDLYAQQNLYGLGPGVYPDREACPWPAHPNTLSFVEMVFEAEVSDADRAGKESTMDALGRMSAEDREGILGKQKAEYFDQGRLKQGMVRSTLRAVDARLERTES